MKVIAITGGIGSGKSVVSHILAKLGYEVYDCDSRAKMLMNTSKRIKDEIVDSFGEESFGADGRLNTAYISKIVFADKDALNRLNGIVHPRVRQDISDQIKAYKGDKKLFFVETAILEESGLGDLTDMVWNVTAPESVRIERVKKRNNMEEAAVRARISSQKARSVATDMTIINDNTTAVLPQIMSLLQQAESM